jgi:hypothetical protein
MKKLILAILVIGFSFSVNAQTSFVSQYNNTIDTISTGGLTKLLTLSTQIGSGFNIVEIQFTATKISGTVGGTVTVQTSLDGIDWYTAPGTSAYTLTDATQTTVFKITNYGARYLRIQSVGSGTMSAQIKAKHVARKVATN